MEPASGDTLSLCNKGNPSGKQMHVRKVATSEALGQETEAQGHLWTAFSTCRSSSKGQGWQCMHLVLN